MPERERDLPERLGRYEIVERLAAGGMGEVFVARYAGPGGFLRPVALKRIHPHLAEDEQFINMLHDEANVAAAVKHPNIVATIDVGYEDHNHFVVLDFVSGDPLSRLLRDLKRRGQAMPPWVVAWIGAGAAAALHAAHEARNLQGEPLDIVHRDVSPQNIMLSDAGHPMLFDFGVAKAKQRIQQTTHGELKGKLAYMAPETFRGAPVDRTVDVFGLGVVLYELLTSVCPFQRQSDLDTITALSSAVIEPPSRIKVGDPALDAIVLKTMARERSERYQTAAQVEQALHDWARAAGVAHEAAAVADWFQRTFPDRVAARKALLARVADPQRRFQPAPRASAAGGTPPPFTPPAGVYTPVGTPSGHTVPLTPGGGFAPPSQRHVDPRVTGTNPNVAGTDPRFASAAAMGTDPRVSVGTNPSFVGSNPAIVGTDPRLAATDPRLGIPDPSAPGAPPATSPVRAIGIVGGAALVGVAIAVVVATRMGGSSAAVSAPSASASAPVAAVTASATAAPTATDAASAAPSSAPVASATATAASAPPRGGARTVAKPPPPDTGKTPGKGPIRRTYE
jgi:serine/threonine-protein kinase